MGDKLLRVKDLKIQFKTEDGMVTAVDGLEFAVKPGESVCIVGESGCGKSVTSMAIMRLLKEPQAKVTGSIMFDGRSLLELPADEMRDIRGNEIAMIFQEPMTALNPVFTCGFQIAEVLRLHQGMNKKEAWKKAIEMMRLVGIPLPEKRVNDYPHQLSGGMRQRAMISMALACKPKLLIADEPTTALDVTIQAQIMELINDLRKQLNMALIMITHDMGVVAEMAERVIVMYAGEAVEEANVRDLFKNPMHPYTQGLLDSIPRLDIDVDELNVIEGTVPSLDNMPKGCRFAPRCKYCTQRCMEERPELVAVEGSHKLRCFKVQEQKGAANAEA